MLDHEGYLAYFRRERRNDREVLAPPRRILKPKNPVTCASTPEPLVGVDVVSFVWWIGMVTEP